MEHFFELPVTYKGEAISFRARLLTFGYSFRFFVMIDKHEVIFEKDDQGQYRALQESGGPEISAELLHAIKLSLIRIQE